MTDQLEDESRQLHRDLDRCWLVIPPESPPRTKLHFWYASERFDVLLIQHHQKVQAPRQLLPGPPLGKALTEQAEISISWLTATPARKAKFHRSPDPLS